MIVSSADCNSSIEKRFQKMYLTPMVDRRGRACIIQEAHVVTTRAGRSEEAEVTAGERREGRVRLLMLVLNSRPRGPMTRSRSALLEFSQSLFWGGTTMVGFDEFSGLSCIDMKNER
eukprot:764909-Hanusia_phi.AAC.1